MSREQAFGITSGRPIVRFGQRLQSCFSSLEESLVRREFGSTALLELIVLAPWCLELASGVSELPLSGVSVELGLGYAEVSESVVGGRTKFRGW